MELELSPQSLNRLADQLSLMVASKVVPIIKAKLAEVSIHAPTQGATRTKDLISDFKEFQSTHPRRVRPGPRAV